MITDLSLLSIVLVILTGFLFGLGFHLAALVVALFQRAR